MTRSSIPATVNIITLPFFFSPPEHFVVYMAQLRGTKSMTAITFSSLLHITMHNTISATSMTSSSLSQTSGTLVSISRLDKLY
ncbi:hypothetical protein E2C01_086766 [Portunus trituberculatus]|uniref:Uncharacterized protein n=1 Tax=Portunus trituberculatus TaxID=210409 RepID=A0A5B7J4P8_PORTR|nr:hypothetical protein [Portunus trituberculatus]